MERSHRLIKYAGDVDVAQGNPDINFSFAMMPTIYFDALLSRYKGHGLCKISFTDTGLFSFLISYPSYISHLSWAHSIG